MCMEIVALEITQIINKAELSMLQQSSLLCLFLSASKLCRETDLVCSELQQG